MDRSSNNWREIMNRWNSIHTESSHSCNIINYMNQGWSDDNHW